MPVLPVPPNTTTRLRARSNTIAWLLRGGGDTFTRLGLFFSKAATVTFGGAYAVLAYVAQQAVERFGWLSASSGSSIAS